MTDKTVTEKASIELKKDKVRARIKELRNRLVEKHEVTVESIAQELEEARTMALKAFTPQAGAAVAASMGKAKLYGLITDKAEIKQTVEVLTDTQLDAEIKRAAKSAGLRLEIDLENRLIVDGKRSIQEQFFPFLKEQKTAILEALKTGNFDRKKEPKKEPNFHPQSAVLKHQNPTYLIPFDAPHLIHRYDPALGFAQQALYIQTPAFQSEITQARAFLKNLYLRGVDTEITPENGLLFVPMPNQPTRGDLKEAPRLQHGIREQLNNPADLFSQAPANKGKVRVRLDDRHSCTQCLSLTAGNTCRQVTKGGKFVAWLDAGALDRPHRCERFRVKAVRH